MKLSFEIIKQIVTIFSTGICLGTFIITNLFTNTKSPTFIEYTDLSKLFLNLYNFFLLVLIFFHSIYPKMVCSLFTNSIGIITTIRGKIVILVCIFVMYFSTESLPQKIFGMISFVSTLALFLAELLLNCDTLKQKPLTNDKWGIINKLSVLPSININTDTANPTENKNN